MDNFKHQDIKQYMLRRIVDFILKTDKPVLGRWSLKKCDEISTSINSIYQNRDHCGDTICKTPKKATEFTNSKKSHTCAR